MSIFRVGSNKSSVNNFPSVRPTLDLDFANSKTLDPRITFTRASGGSYVGADGLIKLAGVNEARFDHDPSTGESLGLLVEESRSNLTTYSEDISQNHFTDNVSIATNQITSPDGTTTADKLTSTITGGTNTCLVQKFSAVSIDTATYTFSVFLKAGTSPQTIINLQLAGGTYQQSIAIINWTSNTITSSSGGTSALVSYPNGWYRVSITLTNNGTNNAIYPRVYVRGQGTDNVNGEFVYIWGWQTEAGAFPTSYIPTEASSRTRAADTASITGKNFSEWYRQDEGTIYSNVKYNARPISGISNRVNWVLKSALGIVWQLWWEATNTGALVNQIFPVYDATIFRSGAIISPGDQVKMASAFKTNNYTFSQAGGTAQTDSSVVLLNNYTVLELGAINQESTTYLNGTIARLTYYPKRLPDAQLIALTK